jgi:hypothetical protein
MALTITKMTTTMTTAFSISSKLEVEVIKHRNHRC